MSARLVTPEDREAVIAIAARGYFESRYTRYSISFAKLENMWNMVLQGDVLCIVKERDGEIVGVLSGLVTEHYAVDMVYATNLALYVDAGHRKGLIARSLIKTFEREARARGVDEIMLGVSFGGETERTVKLYNAMGYETIGGLTVKYIGD